MPIRIALDGIFFSIASSGISHYWIRLLHFVKTYQAQEALDLLEFTIFIDKEIIDLNLHALKGFKLVEKKANKRFTLNMNGSDNPNEVFTQSIVSSGLSFDYAMSTFHTVSYNHVNVGVIHDLIPELLGVWEHESPFWLLKKEYVTMIDACIFASNQTYSRFIECYPQYCMSTQKTLVAYPIIDYDVKCIYPTYNQEASRFKIISKAMCLGKKSILIPGGSLSQSHKYTRHALHSCMEVLQGSKSAIVVVTGISPNQEDYVSALRLARRMKQKHLNIIFQPFSSFMYIMKLYRLASVTLCPSLMEGFGMAVAESVLMGGNVVARGNAGMEEAGGGLVRYFVDDQDDLLSVLLDALNSPKVYSSVEHQLHICRFSGTTVARSFIAFINSLDCD